MSDNQDNSSPVEPFTNVDFINNGRNFIVSTNKGFYCFDSVDLSSTYFFEFSFHTNFSSTIKRDNLDSRLFPNDVDSYYVKSSNLVPYDTNSLRKRQSVQFSKTIEDVKPINGFYIVQLEEQIRVIHGHNVKKLISFPSSKISTFTAYSDGDIATIVFTSPEEGTVTLVKVRRLPKDLFDDNDYLESDVLIGDPIHIKAHNSTIRCLEMSWDGKKFATCSEKGTVIRIYDSENGKMLKEVRRGSKPAIMYSISFSKDNKFICCYSSSGTVHIFGLEGTDNTYSSMYALSYVGINYLSSEWSMLEGSIAGGEGKCAFSNDSNYIVNVVTKSGKYFVLQFDTEKKETISNEHDLNKILKKLELQNSKLESEKLKEKYPGTLPLLIDRCENSKNPILKKRRYLAPDHIEVNGLISYISTKLNLQNGENIKIMKDNTTLEHNAKIADLYEKQRSEDGYLHIQYI